MRWALVALLCAGCIGTPQRPPTAAPARLELEALSRAHFIQGEADATQRQRLAVLLDLHGRGAEAALLEAPDDPARAERAWFAGDHAAPFCDPATARAALPAAQARLATDPRAVRTLWLLGHAARLDPTWLAAMAERWRDDWPESTEARQALALSRPARTPRALPIDLDAWAAAHPLPVAALQSAFARQPPTTEAAPRWVALRILAVWDGERFHLREERLAARGAIAVTRRRAAFVPTADVGGVFRLIVRVWGAPVEARDGAVSPLRADGGWAAEVDGVPGRIVDTWAPSGGPRWVHAAAAPDAPLQEAALRWRLWRRGAGWHGTLEADGLAPRIDGLLAWLPNLEVHALRRLPGGGWRARIAFAGAPARSLLDDRAIEALGGPISMARIAQAPERHESLVLPPAAVSVQVTRADVAGVVVAAGTGQGAVGWSHFTEISGPGTVRRQWRRPAIDWSPARFVERRAQARMAQVETRASFLRSHVTAPLLFPEEE